MPTLQEQMAASGLTLPGMGPPAPPPPAPPGVLNMPTQTIGPQGLQAPPPPMEVRALPPSSGESLRPNAAPSPGGNPIGPLDLGLLKRPSDAHGPDVNVDLSGMKSEQRVGYNAPPAPANLRAQMAGGGAAKPGNPFANEEAAIGRAREGGEKTLGLRQELGEQSFLQADKRAEEANDFQVEAGERGERHQKEAKAAADEYQKASAEFANDKLDSNRWWASRSAPQKAMGFISLALGGFLQGYNGLQKNPALEAMNDAIARDIDEQRANHATKGEGLKGKQQVYGMMLDRFKDENAAADATHAFYIDRVRAEGDRQAALSQNGEAQAAWQQVDSTLDMKSAELKDRANQALARGAAATPHVKSNLVVPTGDGKGVLFKSEQEATKARERIGSRSSLLDDMKRLRDLEAKAGVADKIYPYSDYNTQRTSILSDANVKKNLLEGQGAMSEGDKKNTEAALGALSGFGNLTGNHAGLVDQAIGRIQKSGDEELRTQAGDVVQMAQNPDGTQAWLPTGQVYDRPSLRQQMAGSGQPPPSFKAAR